MNEMRDYQSRMNDAASRRFETFSYLPEMDAQKVRQQVKYMIDRGWNCAVEHVEPNRAGDSYWYMWKLPLFGERDVNVVMNELNACHNANPGDHVRVIGYDNKRQTQGLSMIVFRGKS
ncbi:MAG: ribulose bisphosphate carboxylase small subunit [Rhodospirillales bacterium]|nr:ribulose bisphosphate carboxylase small subunit [Rhodospirillales bacterium]